MPNRQRHRGQHPEDPRLFGDGALAILRRAVEETSWLLGRGYPMTSAIAVVGNHHQLDARQRLAVQRVACAPSRRAERVAREADPTSARGRALAVDGFNLLITLEVALSGGIVLVGAEGALRDLAGVSGSYHRVAETDAAIDLFVAAAGALAPAGVAVYLDAPVSNSGRLAARLEEAARASSLPLEAHLVPDPDAVLAGRDLVVSSDSVVLDACGSWLNLAARLIPDHTPAARLLALHA